MNALTSCSKKAKTVDYEFPPLLIKLPMVKNYVQDLWVVETGEQVLHLIFWLLETILELVALADVFEDKVWDCRNKLIKQRVEVPETNCFWGFDAYKSLLEVDLDIVILATPPHFRPEHFDACVQAKKHVFMEKPVCVDPVGARQIMQLQKKLKILG